MSRRSKSNRSLLPLTLLMVAMAGTVAVALYVKMTPADRVRPQESPTPNRQVEVPKPPEGNTVLIPVVKSSGDQLSFGESRYAVPAGEDDRVAAVNEFLRTSGVLDPSVRLHHMLIEAGTAELHFTEGLDAGQGSMDEATLIQGLRAVLGQFEYIKRFVLFTDGHEVKELGHFELGDPIDTLPVSRWNDPLGSDEAPPPSMPR